MYLLHSFAQRYGFALGAGIAAGLAQYMFDRTFGFTQPFTFFYPAVVIVALLGGFAAGVLATTLTTAIALYFLLPPLDSFCKRSQPGYRWPRIVWSDGNTDQLDR